jgi:hypothetical protein
MKLITKSRSSANSLKNNKLKIGTHGANCTNTCALKMHLALFQINMTSIINDLSSTQFIPHNGAKHD